MKKSIVLIVVLSIVLSISVIAENIPTVCEDLVLDINHLKPKGKTGIYDINGDGVDEKVVITSLREELPLSISLYGTNLTNKQISIESYEGVRFDEGIQVLYYHDKYYIQHYRSKKNIFPTYLTYINSKNIEIPVCKFTSEKKLLLKKEYNLSLCTALLKRYKEKGEIIFDIPSKFKFDTTKSKKEYGFNLHKTSIGNMAYLDFNNDGKKEYMQLFEGIYDSKLFYKIINKEEMEILIDNKSLERVSNGWFRYQDKVYFVNGHIESINNPPSIGFIDNNISKIVCTYDIDTDIMLDINQTKSFFKANK